MKTVRCCGLALALLLSGLAVLSTPASAFPCPDYYSCLDYCDYQYDECVNSCPQGLGGFICTRECHQGYMYCTESCNSC